MRHVNDSDGDGDNNNNNDSTTSTNSDDDNINNKTKHIITQKLYTHIEMPLKYWTTEAAVTHVPYIHIYFNMPKKSCE